MVSFGAVFGLISMAGQLGSSLGPIGVGFLHDQGDSYIIPFTVTAVLTYVAAAIVLLARPVPLLRAETNPEVEPRPGADGLPAASV